MVKDRNLFQSKKRHCVQNKEQCKIRQNKREFLLH